MPRQFRKPESYEEENRTRDALESFLRRCGLADIQENREKIGTAIVQTVRATDDKGAALAMAVRLCWRKRFGKSDEGFAAFQLLYRVHGADPRVAIKNRLDREKEKGRTHWLVVKRDESGITNAVMIPIDEILPIWIRQRAIYDRLIQEGKLGTRKSNPAVNGDSPALYVQDDRAPEAVRFLFDNPAVRNLVPLSGDDQTRDDSFDDLPSPDLTSLGSDGAPRFQRIVSGVKRDPAVRREVVARAHGKCEDCGGHRPYLGFLDVHHILGAEKSDRVWNCVALCPNCHRDAHFSTDRDAMNQRLLTFAETHSPKAR